MLVWMIWGFNMGLPVTDTLSEIEHKKALREYFESERRRLDPTYFHPDNLNRLMNGRPNESRVPNTGSETKTIP